MRCEDQMLPLSSRGVGLPGAGLQGTREPALADLLLSVAWDVFSFSLSFFFSNSHACLL